MAGVAADYFFALEVPIVEFQSHAKHLSPLLLHRIGFAGESIPLVAIAALNPKGLRGEVHDFADLSGRK
jgi:hypothetical protein